MNSSPTPPPSSPTSGSLPPPPGAADVSVAFTSGPAGAHSNFVVTSPVNEVALGADRSGQFAVSVSNVSGFQRRVVLRLVPTEPANVAWFSVDGEAEREFTLAETESYTVTVRVPSDVPAGTYQVRCDAVAEDQPQEDFTTGPIVAVVVPAPRVQRPFPWWIVAAAAVVVVAIGATVFFVTRGDDAVPPNVINIPGSQAIVALDRTGFSADPAVAVVNPCDAVVVSQTLDDTTVQLTFASCQQVRNVPNLVGQRASNVVRLQQRLGFALEVIESGAAAACDPTVLAQSSPPGTRTDTGATLVLVLPSEPAGCNIVSSLPPADGRDALFTGLGN
jgi:hypothetical protein